MTYFFIVLTVLLFTIQNVCIKLFNRSFMKNLASYFLFNAIYFGIVVLIMAAADIRPVHVHAPTVILGVLFGIVFMVAFLLYMKAMENGPLSYTYLIFSFGLLLPIVFGIFIWKEKMGALQLAGLFLLLLTFCLACKSSAGPRQKVNLKWLILSIGSLISNGILMALTKEQQILLPGREIKEFLIIAFGSGCLLSLLLFLRQRVVKKETVAHLKDKRFALISASVGAVTAGGNFLSIYLCSKIPAVVQFPTVNGGVVLLSLMVTFAIFKERLNRAGVIGLFIGLCALVLLSMK
jgi:drug/metabolite transporter (DMT)-like permease